MSKPDVEKKWRKRLQRWRRSGASVAAFCRAEGISTASFYTWRRRIEARDGASPTMEFVELFPQGATEEAPIEVAVDGVVVRLRHGFDPDDLRTVLAVVRDGR